MNMVVKNCNILDMPPEYHLLNVVSGDFHTSVGVADAIDQKYNILATLRERYNKVNRAALTLKVGNVYNMVLKTSAYDTIDYDALKYCLTDLKDQIINDNVKKIATTKIGCGRGGLDWDRVIQYFEHFFSRMDIEIVVCDISAPVESTDEENESANDPPSLNDQPTDTNIAGRSAVARMFAGVDTAIVTRDYMAVPTTNNNPMPF